MYSVWVWDGVGLEWVNAGNLVSTVAKGDQGVTFIPSVDDNGIISWVNDGGRENPEARDITGRTGETGATGPAGKSAYESAQESGYSGEEEAFNAALATLPEHHARHLPGGADPITVKTDNASILLFKTEECPNCSAALALLEKANVSFTALNANKERELVEKYGVRGAPTLVIIKDDGFEKYRGVSEIKGWLMQAKA